MNDFIKNNINTISCMDCLEYLEHIPKESINMILLDPPYNISHAKWDKWKCQKEYVNWLGNVFLECQRVLKDNGSFYFWHNDFQQIAELQHWISQNTRFVFNAMISWVKPNFRNIAWKNKRENSNLRSWFNIQEYCLYYTFEDSGTGLNKINTKAVKYIKEYMKDELDKSGFTKTQLNNIWWQNGWTGTKESKKASDIMSHFFGNNEQNCLPTEIQYKRLQNITGFFQKPYEELRAEYEELRPRFNIKNGNDYNNVWSSKEDNGNKSKINRKLHSCEKPQDLLQKIILTSSNENDIVLDCFAGSGSTAQACLETNRNFLCCERDEGYVKIANERLANWPEDLVRQDKWLNERGVMDFESDIKEEVKQESNQNSLF